MKPVILGIVLVVVGFVAGLLYADWDESPSSVERVAAHLDMDRLRDSVNQVIASNVRVDTVKEPGKPIIRIVKEPVMVIDTLIDSRIDTLTMPPETVLVLYDPWIVWDFAEAGAAATLTGSAHTNLVNLDLSYLDYKIEINAKDICPRRYRLELGGGFSGSDPYLVALVRVTDRLRIGPTYDLGQGRWAGQLLWGLR